MAFGGSLLYLEGAREAGLDCAVVSASANTEAILEHAGLDLLLDERIDGNTIRKEHLRMKPAPDTMLAACRHLGVPPARAAAFETTYEGIGGGPLGRPRARLRRRPCRAGRGTRGAWRGPRRHRPRAPLDPSLM